MPSTGISTKRGNCFLVMREFSSASPPGPGSEHPNQHQNGQQPEGLEIDDENHFLSSFSFGDLNLLLLC